LTNLGTLNISDITIYNKMDHTTESVIHKFCYYGLQLYLFKNSELENCLKNPNYI